MTDETASGSLPPNKQSEPTQVPKPPVAIQNLPEDQREAVLEYFRQIVHIEQTTGHMPPPSMLAAYSPEVQRIIMEEFAQHGQVGRTADLKLIDASIQRETRGMWLGFFLAMALILCGTAVILAGYSAEGLGVIGSTAGALAVAYVVDRHIQ